MLQWPYSEQQGALVGHLVLASHVAPVELLGAALASGAIAASARRRVEVDFMRLVESGFEIMLVSKEEAFQCREKAELVETNECEVGESEGAGYALQVGISR